MRARWGASTATGATTWPCPPRRSPACTSSESAFRRTPEEEEEEEESPGLSVTSTTSGNQVTTGATLTVLEVDAAPPGAAITAKWLYEDGSQEEDGEEEGAYGSPGDFAVDLYTCANSSCADGSCGVFVASLCGEGGCYDPGTGDYDVVVPADVDPGAFTLYVEELSEGGPWDCAPFTVSVNSSAPTPAPTPVFRGEVTTIAPTTPSPAPPPQTTAPTAGAVATAAPVAAQVPATPAPSAATPAGEPGSPGVPPTPVPDKTVCDPAAALAFTYDARDEDGEINIEGSLLSVAHASGDRTELGCATLTDVWQWLQTGPEGVPTDLLYPVDPSTGAAITTASTVAELTGVWLLRTSLAVTNGVTLDLKGSEAAGDCDELKIKSSTTLIHAVRGHGGNLDIYKTLIQSWDEDLLTPHVLPADSLGEEPRSYIACSSEVVNESDTCDGGSAREDMGECRMDMVDSELAHMGYEATESYGITWKVRGFCTDMSNPEVFDNVQVYGDMTNCNIHGMWYGMYSYGHQGGVWTDNLMHDNYVYGFDPHDDSDYLTIRNNTVWNNGKHGIIASKRCDHVVIQDNKVDTSGGSGIMLHRSCDDSEITGNVVYGSADAAVALVETSRVLVSGNVFGDNKWGARLTVGASDNVFVDNIFSASTQREIYLYPGADEPLVEPFTGRCTDNVFESNEISYVASGPINLEYADGTVISNNTFIGGEGYFEFDTSYETSIVGNTGDIIASEDHRVDGNSCFTPDTPLDPTC
ncbi:unnamed protein product [Scytosiphon promiscuus]